jgi:hypothetical protein
MVWDKERYLLAKVEGPEKSQKLTLYLDVPDSWINETCTSTRSVAAIPLNQLFWDILVGLIVPDI